MPKRSHLIHSRGSTLTRRARVSAELARHIEFIIQTRLIPPPRIRARHLMSSRSQGTISLSEARNVQWKYSIIGFVQYTSWRTSANGLVRPVK